MILNKLVSKDWGYELWIANGSEYCGKKLFILNGRKFSIHFHRKKLETFFCASGMGEVWHAQLPDDLKNNDLPSLFNWWEKNKVVSYLRQGDIFHVPRLMVHRVVANTDLTIFEFSTQHFDDDSYRIIKGG